MDNEMESVPPVVDNFYTPVNHEFYAQHSYHDLDASKQQIRLIEIHDYEPDQPLQLKLLETSLLEPDQAHQYCALSYLAGKHTETERVFVNGVPFNAFKNLVSALRRAVWGIKSGSHWNLPTLIWADQICINQSDPTERSQQVGFMREIYGHAHIVLASLGGDDNSDLRWIKCVEKLAIGLFAKYRPQGRLDIDFRGTTMYVNDDLFIDIQDEDFRKDWVAFKDFLSIEWFTRGWIFQEVVCAKDACLMFGPAMMNWGTFSYAVLTLLEIVQQLRIQDETLNDSELRRDMIPDYSTFSFALVMVLSQKQWEQDKQNKILRLLFHAQKCQVTDPRDRIYAFLGLADPGYDIIPDYQQDIATIYRNVAKRIISRDHRLDILCFLIHNSRQQLEQIPSWTPDWSLFHYHGLIYDSVEDYPSFRASGDYYATVSFPTGDILSVLGVFIDSLLATTSEYETYESHRTALNIWAEMAGLDAATWRDGKSEAPYVIDNSISLYDAFVNVIGRGSQKVHYQDYTNPKEYTRRDGESPEDVIKRKNERSRAGPAVQAISIRIRETVQKTVFFRSRHGCIGIGKQPAKILPDHEIWILFGSNVPVILQKVGNHYLFVSEAYVEGMMHGEAIRAMEKGSGKARVINIH